MYKVGDKVRVIAKHFEKYHHLEFYLLWNIRDKMWSIDVDPNVDMCPMLYIGESQIIKIENKKQTTMLFPTKMYSKKEITLEDFQPLTNEVKIKESFDLTYKGKSFKLNKKFLEGQTEFTGFVPTMDNGVSYLLKSTTPETFEKTLFLRGVDAKGLFTSGPFEFVILQTGLDINSPIYLHPVTLNDEKLAGFEAYELSNTKFKAEEVAQSFEEVKAVETPIVQEESKVVEEGEVMQFATQSIEELTQPREDLI